MCSTRPFPFAAINRHSVSRGCFLSRAAAAERGGAFRLNSLRGESEAVTAAKSAAAGQVEWIQKFIELPAMAR